MFIVLAVLEVVLLCFGGDKWNVKMVEVYARSCGNLTPAVSAAELDLITVA